MTTYTNLGIKKITTGDEAGTWGESTNTNFDYFDTAIVGYVPVTLASAGSSGSPNTLNVAEFAVSDGRNRIVEFVDAADLGGTVYVQITPDDFQGYYFIRNGLSGGRSILLFQGTYNAAREYEIVNGNDVVVRCSGEGATSYIYNVLENVQVGTASATTLYATTVATTNIAVTNIDASDGTPSATIDDSTGLMTVSAGVEASKFHTTGEMNTLYGFRDNREYSVSAIPLPNAYSFYTTGATLYSGASISNQYGYFVYNLTQATNNYGFYSDITASGTSRYQFYAAGTAPNYFGGNTIISVTDNTNAALRVTQTGTGNALLVEDSASTDSTPFIVTADGRVGMGVPNASYFPGNIGLYITANDGNYRVLFQRMSNDSSGPQFFFRKGRGTVEVRTGVQSGDRLGTISYSGHVDASNNYEAASIFAEVDGTPGINDMPGRLVFSTTADGASSPTERMRIDSAGTVTITTADINGGTIDATQIGNTSATSAKFNFNSSSVVAVQVSGTDTGPTGANYRITFEDIVTLSSNVSGAGSTHVSYNANPLTAASSALDAYYAYLTYGIQKGAGATVANQYGFIVAGSFAGATTNYAFYTNVSASGTSRYGFYAAGSAPNYFGGSTVISVTDNTNAALRVTQLGTGNSLEIEDSTNPDATPFVVDANGRTIVGYTASVDTKVITTAVTPPFQVLGNQGLYSWTNNATFSSAIVFNKSKSGTNGTLSAVTSGDNLGIIQFNGADNDATPTFNSGAFISAQVAGTVATTSIPARLNFSTTAISATSSTLRMSIGSEGFVGIGATPSSAAQLLDLRGTNNGLTSDAPVNILRFTDTDTTSAANQPIGKIEFYNSDATNAAVGAYILSSSAGVDGGGTIRFGAAANAAAVAEICRVTDTGFTVTKDTAGLGYGTGTGGAVTQATSRTTGVTLNKTNGAITLVSAAGTATWQSFTVTNSTVAATDVVILSQKSGTDLYMLEVTAVAAGSFRISFATTGGTTTEQPVVNFAVIKAVAA